MYKRSLYFRPGCKNSIGSTIHSYISAKQQIVMYTYTEVYGRRKYDRTIEFGEFQAIGIRDHNDKYIAIRIGTYTLIVPSTLSLTT